MSIREELHELVEQLDDEGETQALGYLRTLLSQNGPDTLSALERLNQRMGPGIVSGREFFSTHRQTKDLATLAAEQGVKPVEWFEDLLGDFWPEDEKGEDFDEWLRQIRRDGGYA